MSDELIIEDLTVEDIVLLRDSLKELQVPVGNTQKFLHLSTLLVKLDSIVSSIYD
jgi:hypothetical protein